MASHRTVQDRARRLVPARRLPGVRGGTGAGLRQVPAGRAGAGGGQGVRAAGVGGGGRWTPTPTPARSVKTLTVKFVAPHQPVPPEAPPGMPFRPVEFEGPHGHPVRRREARPGRLQLPRVPGCTPLPAARQAPATDEPLRGGRLTPSCAEGSRGGNRAPLLISQHASTPATGTTSSWKDTEGNDLPHARPHHTRHPDHPASGRRPRQGRFGGAGRRRVRVGSTPPHPARLGHPLRRAGVDQRPPRRMVAGPAVRRAEYSHGTSALPARRVRCAPAGPADARFWRETAQDWQARVDHRPTSDAAGALSNWRELGVTP